jgi:hypothetical protein
MRQKAVFIENNHYCPELLQKTDSQRLLRPYGWIRVQVWCFWPKMAIFEVSAPGFNLHRSQRFLNVVYWDQDQQLEHPEDTGNLI